MQVGAVAFDLDDTLLRDDLTISDETVSVLSRLNMAGVMIVPASGRAADSMRPFVKRIGCSRLFIAGNGAEIYDTATDRCLWQVEYPMEVAREIARFGKEYDCYQQTYHGDAFFHDRRGKWAEQYARTSMLRVVCVGDLEKYIDGPVNKILMIDEPEKIATMYEDARKRFAGKVSVTCSKAYFLEFNPIEATKGNALNWVSGYTGVPMNEMIAFGDSLNDVSMLERVGVGVAMGNGRSEAKAGREWICGTNEEDGVARFLKAHVKGKEFLP